MPAEQLAQIFEVLEGGAQVAAGDIVQFPVDAAGAAAEGALAGEGTTTLVQLGNGAAAEVSQLTVVEGGAVTTSGVGLLAMDVGVAGAAIAPALGILAGVGLYNLAPDFWTNVSNSLVEAGQTIGGKVRAFLDSNTKQVYLSKESIEIFKNAFIQAGAFSYPNDYATIPYSTAYNSKLYFSSNTAKINVARSSTAESFITVNVVSQVSNVFIYSATSLSGNPENNPNGYHSSGEFSTALCSKDFFTYNDQGNVREAVQYTYNGKTFYAGTAVNYYWTGTRYYNNSNPIINGNIRLVRPNLSDGLAAMYAILFGGNNPIPDDRPNIQPGSTTPSSASIEETYPDWANRKKQIPGLPEYDMYPIEIPSNNDNPDQGEAQNPDPDPPPAPFLEWLTQNLPQPDPVTDTDPDPVPPPDPDPQPDPEPIPSGGTDPVPPDPPDPNPVPPTPPTPVVPVLPATVDSNAMFTVYAPSLSQLNSFGGWLWTSSIVEQILRMWQNPLDGIIALMKVYAVPTTGSSRNIQVGYLDSGVSAPVVTSQFVTVDCGSVTVSENKHNATDYSPYVALHLYLPFIGIVELDTDEFMDGTISVKYSIDVYTGTCLAEVKCTRSIDMPNATILYTFSGNASQQLPLTSSNFAGALSSLVSAVGGGIMIASGGAVGGIAGAAALGHSLTHEMVHVGHSGALSSNAGIMAGRTPYLIISKRHAYDAANYATEYGYPANKTVYLGNCSGFTRVKAGHLKSKANATEKEEIMALLQKGVIL